MPLLFFGHGIGDIYDDELHTLRTLAALIDAARADLDIELAKVTEESPLHERGDDLAGFGFVACQKYITAIAAELKVPKGTALAVGPCTASGETLASLVNEAANAWKHEAEWKETLTPQQERTIGRLDRELPENAWDYKYANALYAAAASQRFSDLANGLEEWRNALLRASGRLR